MRLGLTANRNLAYTTVMTVLDRLARKGGVARRKAGRSFVYAPVLSKDGLRRLAVRDLVDSFFEGSEDALLAYLRNIDAPPAAVNQQSAETRIDTALL